MRIPITERIAGTTIRTTMVNSGAVGAAAVTTLLDKNETLVQSVTATASGNGFYYGLLNVPRTIGWYVNEWITTINAQTYVDRQFIRSVHPEVD